LTLDYFCRALGSFYFIKVHTGRCLYVYPYSQRDKYHVESDWIEVVW